MKAKSFFKIGRLMIQILLSASFTSCISTDNFSCPYQISNSRVEVGALEECYQYAGFHFTIFNDSVKDIESFSLMFTVYDSDEKNPFNCSNSIASNCDGEVAFNDSRDYVVSLDKYISEIPDEPYIVDYLYVSEIRYTDGSVWKDPYGMFCTVEEYE